MAFVNENIKNILGNLSFFPSPPPPLLGAKMLSERFLPNVLWMFLPNSGIHFKLLFRSPWYISA